ncbi:hypothetical protein BH23ACT4_BH23ACT4_16380 [soil metagenome]
MTDRDTTTLLLLRHGEVLSHHGDVSITEEGAVFAGEIGASLPERFGNKFTVLSGETSRALETAAHVARGIEQAGGTVVGPEKAHALRNPDLYLGGMRVNMVSSHEALADQVGWLQTADVANLDFFPQFIEENDRIGWWLGHENPPGEGASDVAHRLEQFARSFSNPTRSEGGTVVAVTHSPLLRAYGLRVLGKDIGEPGWVSGFHIEIASDGSTSSSLLPEV